MILLRQVILLVPSDFINVPPSQSPFLSLPFLAHTWSYTNTARKPQKKRKKPQYRKIIPQKTCHSHSFRLRARPPDSRRLGIRVQITRVFAISSAAVSAACAGRCMRGGPSSRARNRPDRGVARQATRRVLAPNDSIATPFT